MKNGIKQPPPSKRLGTFEKRILLFGKSFLPFALPSSVCVMAGAALAVPSEDSALAYGFIAIATFFFYLGSWVWDDMNDLIKEKNESKEKEEGLKKRRRARKILFFLCFSFVIIGAIGGYINWQQIVSLSAFFLGVTGFGLWFSKKLEDSGKKYLAKGICFAFYGYVSPFILGYVLFNAPQEVGLLGLPLLTVFFVGFSVRSLKTYLDFFCLVSQDGSNKVVIDSNPNTILLMKLIPLFFFMPLIFNIMTYALNLKPTFMIVSGISSFAMAHLALYAAYVFDKPNRIRSLYILVSFLSMGVLLSWPISNLFG